MAIKPKSYNTLKPINFSLKDDSGTVRSNTFSTQQGTTFTQYNFLLSANDCVIKNFTSNYLTTNVKSNEIINMEYPEGINDTIISNVIFNSKDSSLKPSSYLTILKNNIGDNITATLSTATLHANQDFVVDFNTIGEREVCSIWTYDGLHKKYLYVEEENDVSIVFSLTGNTQFLYSYDQPNNTLSLFIQLTTGDFGYLMSTEGQTLSVAPVNQVYLSSSCIEIQDHITPLSSYYTDNFVYYNGDNIDNVNSITDITNNYLLFTPYNSWVTYIQDVSNVSVLGELEFFNLKNQISNKGYINKDLPYNNKQDQRVYNNIITNEYTENANEKLQLGYNFFTTEYLIKPDTYTKFVLPNDITPFTRLNINDAGLTKSGAYASNSPYYSDRVYKTQDNNTSVNKKNENNGVLLCSWLKSDGIWYDRYYIPRVITALSALQSESQQLFTYQSELTSFIQSQGIETLNYYDIKSSLMFEQSGTYYYARIGNKYIDKILKGRSNNLLKDNIIATDVNTKKKTLSSSNIQFDNTYYDSINLGKNIKGQFNISFNIKANNFTNAKAYQLIGNLFNTGFTIRKNFYYTPFIIIQQRSSVYFYDTDLTLIKKVDYNIGEISDIYYITQDHDIVLASSNGLYKTNLTGKITKYNNAASAGVIATNTESRSFYGAGNLGYFIVDEDYSYVTDFQTLNTAKYQHLSAFVNKSGDLPKSIINTASGVRYLPGDKGVNVDDDYGVSLSGENLLLFNNLFLANSADDAYFNALSTTTQIYDIAAFDKKLYVQCNNLLKIFNTHRELLSTIQLTTSASNGAKIEFISENYTVKPIVFSRDSDNNFIVDKVSLETGEIEKTYNLSVSGVSGANFYFNPTGLTFAHNTYKSHEDTLNLVTNLPNTFEIGTAPRYWASFGDDWDQGLANNFWAFSNNPLIELTDNSSITRIPINDLNTHISLDFNLYNGQIKLYINGVLHDTLLYPSNYIAINNIVKNICYIGNKNYDEKAITDYIDNQDFIADNIEVSDLRIYNLSFNEDFIRYLYLRGIKVDEINIDFISGNRNNIETIDNLFKYNIPGRLSNNIVIYVKSLGLDNESKELLKTILADKVRKFVPANIDNITFNFDIE